MDGICRSSYALRPWTGCIRGAAGPCGSRPLCGLAFFLPLRMTVYIRFKPSHLSRLALKRNAREIQYCTALFADWDALLPLACTQVPSPGYALPLAHGGFAHDEILSSCRRGTCSVVTFSSGLPRRLRSCALAWAGMGCGSCGRETRRLFGRRVSADGQSSSLRRRSTPG